MHRAVDENFNQYTRSAGHLPLVQALAKRYSPLYGRSIDPLREITVGVGATETLFAAMQSLLNEGDEGMIYPSGNIISIIVS